MHRLAISLAIIALLGFIAPSVVANSLPEYAPVKKNSYQSTERSKLGFTLPLALPKRGIVIAHGSFLTSGAGWVIVDLDKNTLSHLATTSQRLPDGSIETILTSQNTRHLTAEEAKTVIEQANTVWNGEIMPPPGGIVGGPTCDIALFDGESALHLMGIACPAGNLVRTVEDLKPGSNP